MRIPIRDYDSLTTPIRNAVSANKHLYQLQQLAAKLKIREKFIHTPLDTVSGWGGQGVVFSAVVLLRSAGSMC
jgi:hypothetical protein